VPDQERGGPKDADGSPGASAGAGAVLEGEIPLRLPDDVGLAVIAGLADDVRVTSDAAGTSVTMSWKRRMG
jgi:hypothetical protein